MIKSLTTPRGAIAIRQANLGDVMQFRELRIEALLDSPTAFSADHQRTFNHPMKYWEEALVMDENESTILLAENGNRLIGMTGIARGRSP